MKSIFKDLVRALRLPFITATVLPFAAGSLLAKNNFHPFNFTLGLIAAIFTHLGANLINDYADSRSGVDWQDKNFYDFFGGSKLIQEGVFSQGFYLRLGGVFFTLAFLSVIGSALLLKTPLPIIFYILILILAWSYSEKPLQLSYHRLGEPVIFILFGPALVMGGYFFQTGIFPTWEGLMASLPFGILTTVILFANEIPDFATDQKLGKKTWVSFLKPEKSVYLYYCLVTFAFLSIIAGVGLKYLGLFSLASFFLLPLALKAGKILSRHSRDKLKLIDSSRMIINLQFLVGLILILDIAICKR